MRSRQDGAHERRAELAGTWYPDSAAECDRALADFDRGRVPYRGEAPIRGGLVPHAGWTFSGAIAHNAIAAIAESASAAGPIDTVVLFAGHLDPRSAPTMIARGESWTPLGGVETDEELAANVADACSDLLRVEDPSRHSQDNSFELQFPLIRHFFGEARMLAVGAPPRAETLRVADAVVEQVTRLGRRSVFLGSTDLTHYGPNYGWTPRGVGVEAERWVREENDPAFIDRALELDCGSMVEVALDRRNACCPGAAAAAAHCSRALGSTSGTLLRYGTSADIHRSSSFVGYAAIIF